VLCVFRLSEFGRLPSRGGKALDPGHRVHGDFRVPALRASASLVEAQLRKAATPPSIIKLWLQDLFSSDLASFWMSS
jgi:hypothetical protein